MGESKSIRVREGDPRGSAPAVAQPQSIRWPLVWAVGVFQIKLLVDGLKDILLFPLSMIAAAIDLLAGNPVHKGLFAVVLRAGRGFENWVDLFAAVESGNDSPNGLDAHLGQVERLLRDQSKRQDLTARARRAVDDALLALQRAHEGERSDQ